jgi:hypothetical protein
MWRGCCASSVARRAPTLHDALSRVAADGWSHVILDGKLFDTDLARSERN